MIFWVRLGLKTNRKALNLLNLGVKYSRKMSAESSETCIAIGQLTSCVDKAKNIENVRNLAKKALKYKAEMLFLPEATDYIGSTPEESINMVETLDGPTVNTLKEIAAECSLWISVGVHEKVEQKLANDKIYNTQILINNKGDIVASYRKLHLFDALVPDTQSSMMESSYTIPGEDIVPPVDTPAGKLGLMICYDLRFPDTSMLLRDMGAEVITYPSAFTTKTGEAHWELLLRARAIETQCYVVAAAQIGHHCVGRQPSYGHSMIVDPWGHVIASLPAHDQTKDSNDDLVCARIRPEFIKKVRASMPIMQQRREDIYAKVRARPVPHDSTEWQLDMPFADKTIPAMTIFYRTNLSYAFTNLRCVVPGHVLVCSRRPAAKLIDLKDHELQDLWSVAVRVQRVMEQLHNVDSSTLVVQDGECAGRTVPHVHVHVLPRRPGDFERNDDVYAALAQHDRHDTVMPPRHLQDMIKEAQLIKVAMLQTTNML